MRPLPVLALLALAAAPTGCGSTATAQQVRKASDGGTILVGNGSGAPAAMRQAISAIEQHCGGVYEVVEITQVQTGQTTSAGVAYSFGPVSVGSSGSSPVFATGVSYLCRPPQGTVLNDTVMEMATRDIVGRKCATDDDCGPLLCARPAPASPTGTCVAPGR